MKQALLSSILSVATLFATTSLGNVEPAETVGTKVEAVVELFTSQGCSSCPPADAVLEDLAVRKGVLALAFHVDYWDYLGWKDTLGSKASTDRQYAYTASLGTRSVYTPQAVINGAVHTNGADRKSVERLINAFEPLPAKITVTRQGDRHSARVEGIPSGQTVELRLACYVDSVSVGIGRGENAGREIVYVNAVTASKSLGLWSGVETAIDVKSGAGTTEYADGCAVIAQEITGKGAPARIVGATVLPRF